MRATKLQPFTVYFENSEEFHRLKGEIFTQDTYYFETARLDPLIIDAGAHLGLATLYFKKLYPAARIIALEPHPVTFALLEKNVWENQLENVELHQVALAETAGQALLFSDDSSDDPSHSHSSHRSGNSDTPRPSPPWLSTASFKAGAWNGAQTSPQQSQTVITQPLAAFLTQPVDFLKLDIEGAEQAVLMSAAPHLHLVNQMIVEFHPHAQQSLPTLLKFLQDRGFVVTVWKDGQDVTNTPKRQKGLVLIEAHQRRLFEN